MIDTATRLPLGRTSRPPKSRAVRLSERFNASVRDVRAALTTPVPPAQESKPRHTTRKQALTVAALGSSVAGLALLTRVAVQPVPARLDIASTRLLQRRQSRLITRAMVLLSAPGFAPLQHVLTIGTALDLWACGCRREALFALLTMGAGATTGVLKIAVGRPRPDPMYVRALFHFRDNSFPSGHCTHYAAFYGYLFYLAKRCMRPSRLRTLILAAFIALIALVAPSRVYLGHHWTSDVLAGELVGLTYLFLLIQAYEHIWVSPLPDPAMAGAG